MALILGSRIREQISIGGAGAYPLSAPIGNHDGFQTLLSEGDETLYGIIDHAETEFEFGRGTRSGATLARTEIKRSSNANAAVDWPEGSTCELFCTVPGEILPEWFLKGLGAGVTEIPFTNQTEIIVVHNAGRIALVTIVDNNGDMLRTEVNHTKTQFTVRFGRATTGEIAYA